MEQRVTASELSAFITLFRRNREEFYITLFPRIPNPALREHLQSAVQPWLNDIAIDLPPDSISNVLELKPINSMILQDIIKKEGSGRVVGRMVISYEDAINLAMQLEEAGLLFFEEIERLVGDRISSVCDVVEQHRQALGALQTLQDAVRYRKLDLGGV